jgi:hypothetical protein
MGKCVKGKRLWLNLKRYPDIFLQRLRKTMNKTFRVVCIPAAIQIGVLHNKSISFTAFSVGVLGNNTLGFATRNAIVHRSLRLK